MKKIKYYLYVIKLMWQERSNKGRAKWRRIIRELERVKIL